MKRKHHDAIVEWAGGAEIQYRKGAGMMWIDSPDPAWVTDYEYRVKPAREYPKLDADSVNKIANYFCLQVGTIELVSQHVMVAACDNGQVVTREEFDRAIGDRNKRDMEVAKAAAEEGRKSANLKWQYNMPLIYFSDIDYEAIIRGIK